MLSNKFLAVSGTSAPTDAQFNYVTMLLHGDGTNGAQNNTFLDSSTNNFSITRNGNTTQGSFSPYSVSAPYNPNTKGGSGYFDGTGDYLGVDGTVGINAANFTMCFWFYPLSSSVIGLFDSGAGLTNVFRNYPENSIENQGGDAVSFAGGYNVNAWNWMCISKSGTSFTVYINGTSVVTGACNTTMRDGGLKIGGINNGGDGSFYGYLSDFQVLNTATVVAVPTAPIANASGKTLLLNMTNGAIYDNAMMNDLETVGNAQISTSVVKYGTGSLKFSGSPDYILVPNSSNLRFGTGDFTIEFWVYQNILTGYQTAYSFGYAAANAILIQTGNGTGKWDVYIGGSLAASDTGASVSANTWYHIAVVRSGSTVTIYRNGVSVGSGTSSVNIIHSTTGLAIGAGSTAYLNGYIDDLRITKGYARYTTTFTPPTEALPDKGPI